ncbi:manganese efflux pump MntP family protein [Providencia rettgeri]|uniref:manganese efflux pump MntP n=1 Tax=Providencia rettgeri TaxID=587 RepID=UPI00056AA0ED|nr:manganese efflux pump MntP family protein [Providencia rettgeri]QXA60018.1 manganese efflux pump MntP family protein [Providencia rettgeri]
MSFYALFILAFALSMDSFAVAVCKGSVLHNPSYKEALRTGIVFGIVEALMPLTGWIIGIGASHLVMQWNHWIAFGLLFILGAHMIYQSLHSKKDDSPNKKQKHSYINLIITSVATSIDAMAVGLGLAFLDVNIIHAIVIIGLMTMGMATLGVIAGRHVSSILGTKTEFIAGIILISIGLFILIENRQVL